MKKISLFFSVIFVIAISIVSCRPKENTTKENKIKFDTIYSANNYHINNDSTQPSCNIKLTFTYPSSGDDQVNIDSLQNIFTSCFFNETYIGLSPKEAVKNYENSYIESYKEDFITFSQDRDEHDMTEIYPSYYEINKSDIKFNKGEIISYQTTQTNFKGGATSYDFIRNYTIDLKKLQLIDENDIFNDGYEKALGSVFRDKLLKIKNAKSLAELENIGYFGLDEMIPNSNFILNETGITYIFNKGEYSSLKTDPIEIFIPYEEITPLIKDNSIISKFISL